MFTNKTGKAQQQIRTFWKVFVKLLATFTSKSRKHNFRKACLCLLPLVAFHSQGRLFPSLFPPATSNLKQKARTATENETKVVRWRNPSRTRSRRFYLKCLSALYIAKENWLRAKLLNIPSSKWDFKHVRETSLLQQCPLSFPMNHRKFSSIFFRDCIKGGPTVQNILWLQKP